MGLLRTFLNRGSRAPSLERLAQAERKLEEGMALESEGQLEAALHCYDQAIALAPDLPRAHFNRANILLDQGDAARALPSYAKAVQLKPDSAAAHYNLGNAQLLLNNLSASVAALHTALQFKPDFLDAQITLGLVLGRLGRHDEATRCFSRAMEIDPNSAQTPYRIGLCLIEHHQLQLAIANFKRALELQPDFVAALHQCGLACQDLGQFESACDHYQRALALDPASVELHNNLGSVLKELGRHEQAIASYRQALALDPTRLDVHYNLGLSLQSLGQLAPAIASYLLFLAEKGDHYDARISLAVALRDLGHYQEALQAFELAISLEPTDPRGHIHMGVMLATQGRIPAALDQYRQALQLQPDNAEAQLSVGVALKDLGEIPSALACLRHTLEIQPDYLLAHNNLLFIQNYMADQPAEQLLGDARRFGEVCTRLAQPCTDWPNPPEPVRPLRVGLVSGDLCTHPVGYFLDGVLSALASQGTPGLQVFAYSNRQIEDETSQRLRSCCHGWLLTVGLPDQALAQRIRDDRIDILIDLAGHTANNRLAMFAWKPAPVQVSWLGYFATTGVAAVDYFLADPWTLPPDQEVYFTEKVWRLPQTRLCFTPPNAQVDVGTLPALANGYLTFGCFNNLSKMNDAVVRLWARVLQSVPDSRLFLKYQQLGEASVRQRTCERFAAHGIAADRLIFEDYGPRSDYLAAYHRVDIGLDPFPFPGGTTTVEALWMGVPVLTLQGERFLARQGVGLLMNAGLPEWVAADADDYVARAVAHASGLQTLAALRARLRQQVLASPIYDATLFAQHFESALRSMWVKWCREGDRAGPGSLT